jgi:O-6-methylguanine DNA methyltransferase
LSFPGGEGRVVFDETSANREILDLHRVTSAAVSAILRGENVAEFPRLDLDEHTGFRRKVWAEMLRIPCGHTVSYAELARRIGQPNATRAVGGACGANPIPLIIPCHRVLAAGQRLGGFSGGLDWKRKLLAIEKIAYDLPHEGGGRMDDLEQGELAGLARRDF